jgi:PH (Pleckstrin Homology) domain-containing protein
MLLIVLLVILPRETSTYAWVPYLLSAVIVLLLARYLSIHYTITESQLRASKILGGRKIALEEVRKIEYSALRELAPSGIMAGSGAVFGWHGRMWSPMIGSFDTVFTDPAHGLLVTDTGNPLYISPKDVDAFARELSRRVRSYTGPLETDVGHPGRG